MTDLSRTRKWIAGGVALLMVTNGVVAGTHAEPAEAAFDPWSDLRRDEPVDVATVPAGGAGFVDPSADQVWDAAGVTASLPPAGAVRFDLDTGQRTVIGALAAAGEVPVSVRRPDRWRSAVPRAATSGSVTVEVLDAETVRAAAVDGLLVRLTPQGAGPAELTVSYAGFADLFGGGWASRLRLVELPACAVTSPRVAGCLAVTPVASHNHVGSQSVSTRFALDDTGLEDSGSASGDRVFAVTAAASGEGAGDYRATDLSPAGSWSAGGSDGAFTYGYPLRLPPAAGPVPEVSLGYSSAAHDGHTSGTNTQASWIGDGWGYQPGYVERSYRPCFLDDEGSNNPDVTGDLCWDGDGASMTMSLNGTNTTLVRDDASGTWRAKADANWRIELLGIPASPSGGSSERWKVTTTDGTQYFFAGQAGESSSRLTVPVFGNHSGEPCHAAGFAGSSCRQAYRWLLDRVVDVHGNLVRYFYMVETGHYGAAGDPDNRVFYHRAGLLDRVEYGLRADDPGVPPTGRVVFTPANRCLSDCGTSTDPNEENWPDTPWDLDCAAAPCTSQLSPAFFTAKRLTNVTTEAGGDVVDSWALAHEFKDYGDQEQVTLWLKSIQHTGHIDGTATLPATVFGGEALPNRVDAAAGVPVMWRWRMASIKTETGAVITIDYQLPECTPGNLPASKAENSLRCFPVRWTPEFFTDPVEDWFHKHVVASVVETDTTGGSVAVETYYDYATTGGGTAMLWAWDDAEFTEDEHRTYNLWRGYSQVTTRTGDPAGPQSRTRARFYRGLDGQPTPSGGSRSVQVADAEGNTAADHEVLAGRVFESLTYNGPTVIDGSTFQYWTRKTATQQRDHDGGDLHAWLSGISVEKTRTRLTGSTWQRTETRTTFDTQGRPTQASSLGDVSRSGDELCTRIEYADNNTAWIKNAVKRTEMVTVACAVSPSRPGDIASETRTYFDGSEVHGASPVKGLPTRADVLDAWDSGPVYVTAERNEYDPLGRLLEASDALGRTSTTTYTPAGAGPVTQTVSTNPAGHQTTTELDPASGLPTAQVGPNGRRTALGYDPLGRVSGVWLPGRNADTHSPSLRFEYLVRDNAPSAVTTRTLNHVQDYVTSIVLFDSLLRQRQTQVETADRGRLVTETVYDTHGRIDEKFGPNHNINPPDPAAIVRVREEDSARRIGYFYDGAGRVVDEVFYNKHVERWRTTTTYGGSSTGFMVSVQPPQGAPATATITDARGQTIQKRTYHSNTPTGAHDPTSYQYLPTGELAAMTDPAGNQWSWEYDIRGRQVAAVDPDTGTTSMLYDAAGQLVSATDARGQTIVNEYDTLGRQTARRDGDGTLLAEWEFDTAIGGIGMLAKATRWHDGNPYVNQIHTVNSLGLVSQTSVTLPASEGRLAGQYWFTQNYYHNGQVSAQGFDDAGDAEGGGLVWNYDHVGNPTRLRFLGDHTGIHVIVDEATFTPFGEVQTRRFGASNERHAYQAFIYEEGTRRLQRATFDREASLHAVADLRYTYDQAGNITSIADVPEDLPGNHELQCFRYDYQRRLVESWAQGDTTGCETTPTMDVLGGPAPYWHSYDHDVTGNRTSETLRTPGQPSDQRTYTYPPAGQPQPHTLQTITATSPGGHASYDYDPAGNTTTRTIGGQTQTLTWDAEGNLQSVEEAGEQPVRMVYDADGNRLIRDDGDTVTAFMPQTELTWHRDTDTLEGTRYFTHAGHVVAVCTGLDVADWTWMGVDHHGTTTTHAVNAFTAVEQVRRIDPYGNPRGPQPHAWPGQQTFAGGVQDPTGLVHIGARSYDPTTGRFISADPILAIGDDQQINGYAYAHNNPISATDPTGLRDYWNSVNGTPCIDGDCSYHNPNGSLKNPNQCKATGGCGRGPGTSTASAGSRADSTAPSRPTPGRPPNIVNETLEHGTTYVLRNDGRIVLNGILLPAGAPPGAELAPLVDQAIFENGLRPDEVLLAVSWLCDAWVIECDKDFMTATWTSDVAQGLGADNIVEMLAIGGALSLVAQFPGAAGGRIGSGGRTTCRNSFEAGTLVLMADGSHSPIEDIQPGDQVLATAPETGEQSSQNVTAVWAHEDILFDLQVQAPWGQPASTVTTTGAAVITISTTADHPFWNHTDQQWQSARTLDPGDQLLSSDGSVATVARLVYHTRRSTSAYNLTVADIHTYHVVVSGASLLVHNADGCWGPLSTQTTGRTQRLTNAQATDLASYLGYRYTGRTLRGEKVFTNGNKYIVQDSTSHAGGTWKIADSIRALSSKTTRTATTDALLNTIGG